MNRQNQDVAHSRRTVLKSAAKAGVGAGALVAGAGAAHAIEVGDCVVVDSAQDGAYVHDECNKFGSTGELAENGSVGTTVDTCVDLYDRRYFFVEWDGDLTDGWIYEFQLSSC